MPKSYVEDVRRAAAAGGKLWWVETADGMQSACLPTDMLSVWDETHEIGHIAPDRR